MPSGRLAQRLVMTCAALLLAPPSGVASAARTVVPMLATRAPYPATCPAGTQPSPQPNCLLDEGWRSCSKVGGACKQWQGPTGGLVLAGVAGPNRAVNLSVSPSIVAIGSTITVRATLKVPLCTADVAKRANPCGGGVQFFVSNRYLPLDYNAEFNPPLVRFATKKKGCGPFDPPPYVCTGTLLRSFGPAQILTDHYMVIGVGTSLNYASGQTEGDMVEVALSFGHKPKCGASGSVCPLKVFVKPLQTIRSGLAYDDAYPSGGPVNFTVPTFSKSGSPLSPAGEAGQRCMSGCANLLVAVIDPNKNKPVPGADVTFDLSSIAHTGVGGEQFLCTQGDPTKTLCGTSLKGLTTGSNGQLHLIYWAPGEVQRASTTLTATATCGSAPHCHGEGQSATVLTVHPYLIYQHDGELDAKQVATLVELVRDEGLPTVLNKVLGEPAVELSWEEGFKWLWGEELAEELGAAASMAPLTWAIFAGIEVTHISHEIEEQEGLATEFLHVMGIPGTGLFASDPFEARYALGPTAELGDEILHGLFVPGHLVTGGVLWSDAHHLEFQYSKGGHTSPTYRPETIRTDVYEVSHCQMSEARDCGPGYKHSRGIRPALCFQFTGDDDLLPNWFDSFCVPSYDAKAWAETQKGLDKSLP